MLIQHSVGKNKHRTTPTDADRVNTLIRQNLTNLSVAVSLRLPGQCELAFKTLEGEILTWLQLSKTLDFNINMNAVNFTKELNIIFVKVNANLFVNKIKMNNTYTTFINLG